MGWRTIALESEHPVEFGSNSDNKFVFGFYGVLSDE